MLNDSCPYVHMLYWNITNTVVLVGVLVTSTPVRYRVRGRSTISATNRTSAHTCYVHMSKGRHSMSITARLALPIVGKIRIVDHFFLLKLVL
jgi:hypothetical protein